MPLPPPGRSRGASRPAIADSTPRSATVAPFIVPRRTSSVTARDHQRADERGDERRVAAVRLVGSASRAARTGRGTRPRPTMTIST